MSKIIVVLGPESEETIQARKALMSYALNRYDKTYDRMAVIFLRATRDGMPVNEATANQANGYVDLDGKARKRALPKKAPTILLGCESQWTFQKAAKVIPYGEGMVEKFRGFLESDLPKIIKAS